MERSVTIPADAGFLLERLDRAGFEACAVGGCVRDSLLGCVPHDWDLCTSARPEQVKAALSGDAFRCLGTGVKHGTVTVLFRGNSYEITTYRVDGPYSDSRHPDEVVFSSRLEDDLARRDFTVNAMAYSPRRGLVDPFGGETDLRRGVISCVGEPEKRIEEDALRILRALRFAAVYGFAIAPATAEAIHAKAGLLEKVAGERVRDELCRLLCGKAALDVLLPYSDVLCVPIPELAPCVGFEQHSRYHCYDVYEHMARAAAACGTQDAVTRFALLLHDMGKPRCFTMDERGGHFKGHAEVSAALAGSVLDRLRFDGKRRREILELILFHDTPPEPTPKSVRRRLARLGPEQLFRLLEVARADALAHAAWTVEPRLRELDAAKALLEQALAEDACFSLKDLAVRGDDLLALGVPEGKQVGTLLRALLDEVLDGESPNERQALLGRAAALLRAASGRENSMPGRSKMTPETNLRKEQGQP